MQSELEVQVTKVMEAPPPDTVRAMGKPLPARGGGRKGAEKAQQQQRRRPSVSEAVDMAAIQQ